MSESKIATDERAPDDVIELVEEFERQLRNHEIVIRDEATRLQFVKQGETEGTQLGDGLSHALSEYDLNKHNSLRYKMAGTALIWINRGRSWGAFVEGPGLLGKVQRFQEEISRLKAESEKLQADNERLSSDLLISQGRILQL